MNAISIEKLSLIDSNSGKYILKDLNLGIRSKKVTLIAGKNGAGKSTLLKCILGLVSKYDGKINYFLSDTNDLTTRKRFLAETGVQFQQLSYFNTLTVLETFKFFSILYGHYDNSNVSNLVAKLGLQKVKNSYVKNLSGGQKQRVNLGLSLVNNPEVIIMDEPTNGFDSEFRITFWNIIKALREQKKTVILITHYLAGLEDIVDDVVFLNKGRIIKNGILVDLLSKGKSVSNNSYDLEDLYKDIMESKID